MITLTGKVIHGEHFGQVLGFPTANLDRRGYARRKLKIRLGIYAGFARLNHKLKHLKSAIVIGPLDERGLPKIEAHLINFKGNLYGKKISISLQKYLRPFRKFKTRPQLKKQIRNDVKAINKLLA